MARRSGAASAIGNADRNKAVLDAAFRLVAERGWPNLSLADVSAAAGVSLGEVYAIAPLRMGVLAMLIAHVDEIVLADTGIPSPDEPRRDRLFDLLMRRFDALAPYKEGVRAILGETSSDPLTVLAAAPQLAHAMAWMLEAVGVPVRGIRGQLRIAVLSAAYLSTFRAWLRDDSPDLSATMAALDRALSRAGRLL